MNVHESGYIFKWLDALVTLKHETVHLRTEPESGEKMLIIPARVIWQIYPNLWCCIGFWAVVLWLNRPQKKSPHTFLVFIGAVCNAVATVVNGGKMPVLGKYGSPVSVWRAARPGDHVLILCDRFGGFSIGDVLIGGSLVLGIGLWLWKLGIAKS